LKTFAHKVLIITYYWPPSSGAGVQRWLKFAKYLPSLGWEPVMPLEQGLELTVDWVRSQQAIGWSERIKQTINRRIERLKKIRPEIAASPSGLPLAK